MDLSRKAVIYSTLGFYLVSSLVTAGRIVLRLRKRMFWWDDLWAVISFVGFTLFVAGQFILDDGQSHTQHTRVAGYYMITTSFYSAVWTARLALTFTIMRIAPWNSQKRVMLAIAVAIFLQWVVLVIQMYWVCLSGEIGWALPPFAMCLTSLYGQISQVITEVLSSIPLVAAPIWILRTARVSSAARFRLVQVLICSSATIIVGIANTVMYFRFTSWAAFTGALEISVALGMCNLPIVVPALALRFGGDAEKYEDSRDHGTAPVHRAPSLGVRVELAHEQERASLDRKADVEIGGGENTYMLSLHKD